MPAKVVAQRYELTEKLGEGGMGVVYRGVDTRTSSLVAIKTLKNASDPETLAMFRKEWGELVNIVHPNIVGVRDVGEFEENGERVPFFVMPLLQGCTLAVLIQAGSSRLTVENVVEIICQVCRGLNTAHEAGLIHRDLKPSNIFVNEDGTAQIIDFGLVHSALAKTDLGIKGTWQYMSPEQTEGKKVTRASDIFSLGVVAYEALTGKQPFSRRSSSDTAEAVRHYSPQPVSEFNPKVGDIVSKAIHVAMAKQAIHRYSSAREFADTLQKAYHNQPIERFDPARIQPKIKRAREAFDRGDCEFASELLIELETEGNVDPQITLLRAQVEESAKQKRVRNLFEAAQTRVEQHEIPLAIAKLAEVLTFDPENAQALSMIKTIEKQRDQEQLSGWMKRAREHLERNDFSEARQALDEAFKVRYDEPEVLRLRSEIEVRQKDASQARIQKEKLYSTALRASENGELSSAISSLEKLIDVNRAVPGAVIPERDKVYQAFYSNMIAERDAIDHAYEEGCRHLTEKQFDKALHVCDRVLAKYPVNAQFQALRIKIRDAQGLFLSAYIAEVGRMVESEANLDRRVALLEEANERFPNEQQFVRQLRLAREHRDLVSSILGKAKAYEEQEQFAEAIQQWKILAGTHPQYVGTDSEITQLEARRLRQNNQEKKSRWVQRIDQALDNRAYAEALRLSAEAHYDFPNDQELATQERIAKQGLERILEADRLFEEAKASRSAGRADEAIGLLKDALKQDDRHFEARGVLINLLCELAHESLDSNVGKARALAQEAKEIDGEHPSVKRIAAVILEKRRTDAVTAAISQARELQNNNPSGAAAIIDRVLTDYPGDQRLIQFRSTMPAAEKIREVAAAVSPLEQTRFYDQTQEAEMSGLERRFSERAEHLEQGKGAATNEKKPATSKIARPAPPKLPQIEKAGKGQEGSSGWLLSLSKIKNSSGKLVAVGAICLGVLAAVIAAFMMRGSSGRPVKNKESTSAGKIVAVSVITEPTDAEVRADDVLYPERTISLRNDKVHPVRVSRIGYKALETTKSVGDSWRFVLTPEPIRISISTNAATGDVLYDGRKIGELTQGSFSDATILPAGGKHVLSATDGTNEIFHVSFQAKVGSQPTVDSLDKPELTVISSLGDQTSVYSGTPGKIVIPNVDGSLKVDKNGVSVELGSVDLNSPPVDVPLQIDRGKHQDTVSVWRANAPALTIYSTGGSGKAESLGGKVSVVTKTKNATLFVDGRKKPGSKTGTWHLNLPPGEHQFKLVAVGMRDQEWKARVANGGDDSRNVVMEAAVSFSTLSIKGATPSAKVLIDQQEVGLLDGAGAIIYDRVSPGEHDVTLEKDDYVPLTSRQIFKDGKVLELPGNLKLNKATGGVTLSVTPASGKLEYSLTGKNEWHAAQVGTLTLPPGNYDFAASAAGYKPSQKQGFSVTMGKVARVDFVLEQEGPKKFLTSLIRGLTPEQGWYLSANAWVPVPAGTQKCTILFLRPDRYPDARHRPKHLEWAVTLDANRVSYSVEEHNLVRKSKVEGQAESSSKNVNPADDLIYSFVIVLEGRSIQIKSRDGAMIDEFKSDGLDWTHAKISVRGNAYFDVRP